MSLNEPSRSYNRLHWVEYTALSHSGTGICNWTVFFFNKIVFKDLVMAVIYLYKINFLEGLGTSSLRGAQMSMQACVWLIPFFAQFAVLFKWWVIFLLLQSHPLLYRHFLLRKCLKIFSGLCFPTPFCFIAAHLWDTARNCSSGKYLGGVLWMCSWARVVFLHCSLKSVRSFGSPVSPLWSFL